MAELESSYNVKTSNNQGYNQASALKIRLDPTDLIENVELFLRGSKVVVTQDDNGKIKTEYAEIGRPKANPLGVQSILNWVQLIINPHTVQGNFAVDGPGHSTQYEDYIFFARVDFTSMLVTNTYIWDIYDEDIDVIVDSVMNAVEPYMTRLIDNKERESYDNTVKHTENSTIQDTEKGPRLFGNVT